MVAVAVVVLAVVVVAVDQAVVWPWWRPADSCKRLTF